MSRGEMWNKKFIENSKSKIVAASISNAERLLAEGRLLLTNKFYSRATHLFISGFEELAKALLVEELRFSPETNFNILTKHNQKLGKLLNFISRELLAKALAENENLVMDGETVGKIEIRNTELAKKLSKVLQETMYVGLSEEASRHGLEPNNEYWRSEATRFSLLLENRIQRVKEKLEAVGQNKVF